MNLKIAENLAVSLMTKHGVSNWTFIWSNAQTSFGHCNYGKKQIALSKFLTNIVDEAHVYYTLLHEIAHAWTPGHKHDIIWYNKYRELGGIGDNRWQKDGI